MSDVPVFRLHGEDDDEIEGRMQAKLALRNWRELSPKERDIIKQELFNKNWIDESSREVLTAVEHLNTHFLRDVPGKRLHRIKPQNNGYTSNDGARREAAYLDFQEILFKSENEDIVLRMLSAFARAYIKYSSYKAAMTELDAEKRAILIKEAFAVFDRLANTFNYLFRQFAVNVQVNRSGFIPVQDAKLAEQVYSPALSALSDPKFAKVNDDLAKMFADYRSGDFGDVITKAHSAVQRFLQISTGAEGKNGKGEMADLFAAAKANGLVSSSRFSDPLIKVLQGFFPSERATKSTAKPALKEATSRDAMLMMDLVMVFLHHCLTAQ